MASCSDPRMTYLNESGYNVVRLPSRGITPLGVIGCDGKSRSWLGTLDQIWVSDQPIPKAGDPKTAAGLSGARTNNIESSIGLEILANALVGMLGGATPSVNASYESARFVQFAFKDVRAVGIDPFRINDFLTSGELKGGPFVERFFSGKFGIEALVISEILEARAIGVTAKRDMKTTMDVDVPQIQAAVGAKVKVSSGSDGKTEVVYEGDDYLTFGFKAFGIAREGGRWKIYGKPPSGKTAYLVGDEKEELPALVEGNELVDIDFPAPGPLSNALCSGRP